MVEIKLKGVSAVLVQWFQCPLVWMFLTHLSSDAAQCRETNMLLFSLIGRHLSAHAALNSVQSK